MMRVPFSLPPSRTRQQPLTRCRSLSEGRSFGSCKTSALVLSVRSGSDAASNIGFHQLTGAGFEECSSSAVGVCRRILTCTTDYRATVKFFPGLSAFEKPSRIFQLEQKHALDRAVARSLVPSFDANKNSGGVLLEDSDVDLRVARGCLDASVLLAQLTCDEAVIAEGLLALVTFRADGSWKRGDVQFLDHELRHLLGGIRRIVFCQSHWHAGQSYYSTEQFHFFPPSLFAPVVFNRRAYIHLDWSGTSLIPRSSALFFPHARKTGQFRE